MKIFKVGFKSGSVYSVNMIWANTGKEEREAVEETAARRADRYGYEVAFVEEITEREAQSNISKGMPYYGIDEQAERDHDPSFSEEVTEDEAEQEPTVAEIVTEIKANAAEIAAIDAEVKSAKWTERKAPEIIEKANRADLLRIKNKILKDNARHRLVAEVLPVCLEELYKYAGKGYGEKTKEKVREAVKARTGCAFYVNRGSFNDELCIVPLNERGGSGCGVWGYGDFNIYPAYNNGERPRVLVDNKINPLSIDQFVIGNYAEYVSNPDKRAEEIRDKYAVAKAAKEAAERACSEFNSICPSGIDHLSVHSWRNYIMM